jgi:hypothetical protein
MAVIVFGIPLLFSTIVELPVALYYAPEILKARAQEQIQLYSNNNC